MVKDVKSDATIGLGQSASFRFKGTPGNASVGPTNFVLNGVALSGIETSARTMISQVEPSA